MFTFFDPLRDLSFLGLFARLLLASLCSGLIGLERANKLMSAGLRTHMLICLGATATTMTSQFMLLYLHQYTDISRLGAQVVSGIGFIGAGSIIITQRVRIKGLTTAAGLWTTAIIGLCIGGGFYEIALLASLLIILAETVFVKIEALFKQTAGEKTLYLEYAEKTALSGVFELCRQNQLKVSDLEIARRKISRKHNASALIKIYFSDPPKSEILLDKLKAIPGITLIEEL